MWVGLLLWRRVNRRQSNRPPRFHMNQHAESCRGFCILPLFCGCWAFPLVKTSAELHTWTPLHSPELIPGLMADEEEFSNQKIRPFSLHIWPFMLLHLQTLRFSSVFRRKFLLVRMKKLLKYWLAFQGLSTTSHSLQQILFPRSNRNFHASADNFSTLVFSEIFPETY